MAGDRFTGAIVNAGVPKPIPILPSQIIPPSNQDVKFTVYPIAANPALLETAKWDVSLALSAPDVPGFAPTTRDFGGKGVSESYTYTGKNWVASAGATATVRVSFINPIPATGNYLFEVDSEVPNSKAGAESKGATGFTQTGFVGRSDSDDYYQFVIPNDQKLKEIKLSGLKDTANLELYKQSAEGGSTVSLKTVTDPSTNDKVITDALTGGTYYVGVSTSGVNTINLSDGGQASTPYSLSVALESASTTTVVVDPPKNPPDPLTGVPVKRFLNTAVSGHFYTLDAVEANTARSNPQFREEAPPFKSGGTFTVQRYKNINNGAYFYAANPKDITEVSVLGVWKLDSPSAFKVYPVGDPTIPANAIPVQRFFNTKLDGHFYSTNATDTANASAIGFRSEGIGFYALPTV